MIIIQESNRIDKQSYGGSKPGR